MMIHHVFLVCFLVYGVMAACPPKITPKPDPNAGATTTAATTASTTQTSTTTTKTVRKKRESKDGELTSKLNDVEDVNPASAEEKCDNASSTLMLSIPTIVISITAYLTICVH